MIRTLAESIQALYGVTAAKTDDIVTQEMIRQAWAARKERDPKKAGALLSQIYQNVADAAGGWELRRWDKEQIGGKIGWLMDGDIKTDSAIKGWLGQYQRDLALPAMNEAIKTGASQGLVKEVVREATGDSTCPWCLERCGIWNPYDANMYGVWGRHEPSCDCNIFIRWRQDDENTTPGTTTQQSNTLS